MKGLFFLLLLANIGLFIWLYPQAKAPEPEERLPPGVQQVLLVDEPVSGSTVSDQVDQADQADQAGPPQAAPATPPPGQPAPAEVASIPAPVPAGESREEGAGADVVPSPPPRQQPAPEAPEPVAAGAPSASHCRTIGPLEQRTDADKLSLRLRALGLQPQISSETRNQQNGYWVLVPPQSSRAQAIKIVRRLKAAGIHDLWRFTSGRLAHAISLGLYKDERRALIRRDSIAEKGFEVEVRPRYRETTRYWVGYSYQGEPPMDDQKWTGISAGIPQLERQEVDCQAIATP